MAHVNEADIRGKAMKAVDKRFAHKALDKGTRELLELVYLDGFQANPKPLKPKTQARIAAGVEKLLTQQQDQVTLTRALREIVVGDRTLAQVAQRTGIAEPIIVQALREVLAAIDPKKKERLLTSTEAAELIQVTASSVVKWTQRDVDPLKSYGTPGGHRRIRESDLRAFCLTHGIYTPPELSGGA